MTTAEQPQPEGDNQPPQAASVDDPQEGAGAQSEEAEGGDKSGG